MTQQQQTQQVKDQNNCETKADTGENLRRNNRGCKSEEFYKWSELPFEEMESPLAAQQYIQQLIRRDPSDIDEILKLPEGQELGAWKIEHLRLFCMQLNRLATKLQDCCQPETCNQMTATEQWIFLCAAHKQPNECPAIDYTRHTLDGAASLLNSNKYFPSRVTIKESSVAKLGSVCRRVYRIFSHAYYHHFQVFDQFEKETHLCKRFSKFVTIYQLMSKDTLIVPSDGSKPEIETQQHQSTAEKAPVSDALQQQDPSESPKQDIKLDEENNGTSQVKSETSSKKQYTTNEEAPSNKNKSSPAWTVSQNSTNTIVKGSGSLINSSKSNNDDETSKLDGENSATIPTTTKTSTITTTSSKDGLESEA